MKTDAPIQQWPYEIPRSRVRWPKWFNLRIAIFSGIILLLSVGVPFFLWFNAINTVHYHGDYREIDLKAMSAFDMDQRFGKMTDIPSQFRELDGKKVSTIGQIWAPNYSGDGNIRTFQMVYSLIDDWGKPGHGPPLAQQFVDCNIVQTNGKWPEISFVPGDFVTVFGTMHVYLRKDPGDGVIKSIYHIDVEQAEPFNG